MASKSAQGKKLVIVESPTKARTIRKFLGSDFIVESCMGHVRDLPKSAKEIPEKYKKQKWARLGVNVEGDFEAIYLVPKNKTKIVTQLKSLLKEADELYLATDEDREGESISWHLLEVLKPKVPVKRMVFHEITKKAILGALEDTREINFDMVRAQEARRILDRLVGFTISPLLWKKVAYGLSAGRVQSVAVKLISKKEHERMEFVKNKYQSVTAHVEKDKNAFEAKLLEWQGKRVATGKDFKEKSEGLKEDKKNHIHLTEKLSGDVLDALSGKNLKVVSVEEKPVSRKPSAPFITSTLQQEASRKLNMTSREAMQVAQKLYEQGYITYMRTDSTFLSNQAIEAARSAITDLYGKEYLPEAPRDYAKKKVKGAQEAHEAIRPAGDVFAKPEDTKLKGLQLSLYDLIWKRTVASQMVNAKQKQLAVRFEAGEGLFGANGLSLVFPGFFKAYVEGSDDPEQALSNKEVHLPQLAKGDDVKANEYVDNSHETKPPARYTEASLIQMLEKEGVGRPSTYASIIGTVQDRGYVNKVGNSLQPTFTALIVTKLLETHLPNYVDLGFTSGMEDSLDDVAEGDKAWTDYLKEVYSGDEGLKASVDRKEEEIDVETSRSIQVKGLEELSFKVGRYGAYVCKDVDGAEVCASLPEDHAPADVSVEYIDKIIDQKINGTDALGEDPETGLPIYVLTGRYGPYVQLGDSEGEKEKPKRSSVPPTMNPDELSLEQAIQLLSLPKVLGTHPDTDVEIKAGLGRFGPFIVYEKDFRSIPKDMDLFTINLAQALELLARPKGGRGRA
ncbi:MAG: type I DNA topoisomerase, partial [Bdellovibrionales bacterium]